MAKLYTFQESKSDLLNPKESTIEFLLSYSKALSVMKYKEYEFESLLN
ncbi:MULTISPECIES: hypothetical protein [Galbibacter]|uniref:Uncharacterized protein n=1 Tax=Galbibacter pacificus TaxID=2996052 RepID=A0ABT6FQQ9_9FLAO|nr:hypothetical protein [Galbibacter pacificus]MDG3581928.1 hypothetical protein [Galbibacter pacificus]MDG3585598.1 hypothetical protein [Galbibacter pacificus]